MQPELKQRLEHTAEERTAKDPSHRRLRQRHERAGPPASRAGPRAFRFRPGFGGERRRLRAGGRALFRRPARRRTSRARRWSFSPPPSPRKIRNAAAAVESGILCVRRAECLVVLADAKSAYVIAGSHGKTTTSSMLTHVLRQADLNPSHYIGAQVPLLGANASWTDGKPFVVEADESDGTLALFAPAGQPHPQHRGGASRFLSRHRGDRAGLRRAVRADARPDRLLRRRQEHDAALLARAAGGELRPVRTGGLSRARRAAGKFLLALHRPAPRPACSAKSRWKCPARRT